ARVVPGEHDVEPGRMPDVLALQIVRHDAEARAQLPHVPALLAEEEQAAPLLLDRIDLAREQLEQRRLAGAVRTEDRGVAAARDRERQAVEDARVAAVSGDVLQFDDVHGKRETMAARIIASSAAAAPRGP